MKRLVTINVILLLLHLAAAVNCQDAPSIDCDKYIEAAEKGAKHHLTYYNAACCFALAGNMDEAFLYLDTAIAKGYKDFVWLKQDPDFYAIHFDPKWETIVNKCAAAQQEYMKAINAELYTMYEADQSDRAGEMDELDWTVIVDRDEKRRRRTWEMIEVGELKVADDYFHAAMILQHGNDTIDYKMAHELASKADELGSNHFAAKWLSAAAWDRYLWQCGRPQWYGTQFQMLDGKWTIEPIDSAAVTGEERLEMGVPTLSESRLRATEMNK